MSHIASPTTETSPNTETSSTPLPSTPSSPFTSLHLILPTPTYTPQPPYPSKKSHARKQPANHIPRPRNAFMLFRSDLIRQKKIPPEVENDQGNISRIAGTLWRSMSPEDKQPWLTMAIQEKQLHCSLHPGYRYAPIGPRRRKGTTQTQAPVPEKVQKRVQERERPKVKASWGPLDFPLSIRRSSSCPPGAQRIPNTLREYTTLTTHDDMHSRRPSRVTLYQSTPVGTEEIIPPHRGRLFSGMGTDQMTVGPYSIPPPVCARGWDGPPPKPVEWTHWEPPVYSPSLQELEHYANTTFNWSTPNPFTLPPLDRPLPFPDTLPMGPTDTLPPGQPYIEDYDEKNALFSEYGFFTGEDIEVLLPNLSLTDTRVR